MKVKSDKTQNPICTSGHKDIESEIEKDCNDEFAMDALMGIEEEETCEHMPDMLIPMDIDYLGDTIIHRFNCKCGKIIHEIFRLSEVKVLD